MRANQREPRAVNHANRQVVSPVGERHCGNIESHTLGWLFTRLESKRRAAPLEETASTPVHKTSVPFISFLSECHLSYQATLDPASREFSAAPDYCCKPPDSSDPSIIPHRLRPSHPPSGHFYRSLNKPFENDCNSVQQEKSHLACRICPSSRQYASDAECVYKC